MLFWVLLSITSMAGVGTTWVWIQSARVCRVKLTEAQVARHQWTVPYRIVMGVLAESMPPVGLLLVHTLTALDDPTTMIIISSLSGFVLLFAWGVLGLEHYDLRYVRLHLNRPEN
jgi:hypothetical protein